MCNAKISKFECWRQCQKAFLLEFCLRTPIILFRLCSQFVWKMLKHSTNDIVWVVEYTATKLQCTVILYEWHPSMDWNTSRQTTQNVNILVPGFNLYSCSRILNLYTFFKNLQTYLIYQMFLGYLRIIVSGG